MKYVKPLQFYTTFFKDILSGTSRSHGRLLGFDVRTDYVSLAVSDWRNVTAVPLGVLPWPKQRTSVVDTIATSISMYDIVGFIVGTTYLQCPDRSTFSPRAKIFIKNLSETGNFGEMKFTYWDGSILYEDSEFVFNQHVKYVVEYLNGDTSKVRPKLITNKCYAVSVLQGYLDVTNKLLAEDCI